MVTKLETGLYILAYALCGIAELSTLSIALEDWGPLGLLVLFLGPAGTVMVTLVTKAGGPLEWLLLALVCFGLGSWVPKLDRFQRRFRAAL